MLEAAAGSLHSAVRTCVLPIRHTCQHQRLVLAPAPQMEQRPLCMQLGCGGECGGAAVKLIAPTPHNPATHVPPERSRRSVSRSSALPGHDCLAEPDDVNGLVHGSVRLGGHRFNVAAESCTIQHTADNAGDIGGGVKAGIFLGQRDE